MLRGWLHGKGAKNASTQSLDALAETQNLESAMRATAHIFNDDVEAAEKGLAEGDSAFHKLGLGITTFIRATLGFEQEIMRQASERLLDAENTAASAQTKAAHNANAVNAYRSDIYQPGTEFALAGAEAQLMCAVVGVLNESLTESIRGFYKLRKAYYTLSGILDMEKKFMQERVTRASRGSAESLLSATSQTSKKGASSGLRNEVPALGSKSDLALKKAAQSYTETAPAAENDDDDEFFDASEETTKTPDAQDSLGGKKLESRVSELTITTNGNAEQPGNLFSPMSQASVANSEVMNLDPDSEAFTHAVDGFIHSGANLCFGVLQLLISMIPPAFGKLLYIVGFKGHRENGLRMLWQASKFDNVNGGTAGLVVLGWYNALAGFCDIMSDGNGQPDDIEGYPVERLETLIADMRARYPKSSLWKIEQARMASSNRNLEKALEILLQEDNSPLKQVEALKMFERSLDAMYLHRYELCAESFMKCAELNSWSRALYYYVAGAAHVSLYRQLASTDTTAAAKHADKADEMFHYAPSQAGKKRFMARQLPFDIFVARKIQKWDARAKEWNVKFVDAVGVDPIEEMIFLWGGYKKMTVPQLEASLENLAWSESSANEKCWSKESLDERAILALLRAAVLRNLRKHEEAIEILKTEILSHDRAEFKGALKDDWTAPTAHFEMAANYWMMRDEFGKLYEERWGRDERPRPRQQPKPKKALPFPIRQSGPVSGLNTPAPVNIELDRENVAKCAEYIEIMAKWESYSMDARLGMKIPAARDALANWHARHPKE